MSIPIVVGFFIYWGGFIALVISLYATLAESTRGKALVIFFVGIATGVIPVMVAVSLGYSPDWGHPTLAAYAIIICIVIVGIIAYDKPLEDPQVTDENSRW